MRAVLDKMKLLRFPANWRSRVELASIMALGRPFSDPDDLCPRCARCGTSPKHALYAAARTWWRERDVACVQEPRITLSGMAGTCVWRVGSRFTGAASFFLIAQRRAHAICFRSYVGFEPLPVVCTFCHA